MHDSAPLVRRQQKEPADTRAEVEDESSAAPQCTRLELLFERFDSLKHEKIGFQAMVQTNQKKAPPAFHAWLNVHDTGPADGNGLNG